VGADKYVPKFGQTIIKFLSHFQKQQKESVRMLATTQETADQKRSIESHSQSIVLSHSS
jgi:hypothetical protein